MSLSRPSRAIIIPAAGSGTRFLSSLPKQFHLIGGEPILLRTIRTACQVSNVSSISVGVQGDVDQLHTWLRSNSIDDSRVHFFEGAQERQFTVMKALQHLSLSECSDDVVVIVHDAVRPLASVELWERVASAAEQHGAAIPVLAMADTVKVVSEGVVVSTPDRSSLVRVQTPQGFRMGLLRQAYEQVIRDGVSVTDCSSVVELSGYPVHLVDGDETNFKITTPYDLAVAEFVVANFMQ